MYGPSGVSVGSVGVRRDKTVMIARCAHPWVIKTSGSIPWGRLCFAAEGFNLASSPKIRTLPEWRNNPADKTVPGCAFESPDWCEKSLEQLMLNAPALRWRGGVIGKISNAVLELTSASVFYFAVF